MFDESAVSERYFFPRTDPPEHAKPIQVDGAVLQCSHLPGTPTLLHFHGNGEVTRDWSDLQRVMGQSGYGCLLAEYRGYGGSTGAPQLVTMLDDALAIHDAIEGPVVVYGRSVGSIYALHVAANRPVAGLLLESGIADVHQRLRMRFSPEELDEHDLTEVCATHFDHQAKLARVDAPVHVLHAAHDNIVFPDHADRLARWAGVEPEIFRRGDHNSMWTWNAGRLLDRIRSVMKDA